MTANIAAFDPSAFQGAGQEGADDARGGGMAVIGAPEDEAREESRGEPEGPLLEYAVEFLLTRGDEVIAATVAVAPVPIGCPDDDWVAFLEGAMVDARGRLGMDVAIQDLAFARVALPDTDDLPF